VLLLQGNWVIVSCHGRNISIAVNMTAVEHGDCASQAFLVIHTFADLGQLSLQIRELLLTLLSLHSCAFQRSVQSLTLQPLL